MATDAQQPGERITRRTRPRVVLLVDDDPAVLQLMLEMIGRHIDSPEIDARTALDGAIAWQMMLEADVVDAVVLDRRMPQVPGLELLARMKAHPRLGAVPVIVQTGIGGLGLEREAMQAGAFYHLRKPFSGPQLAAVLGEALRYGSMTPRRAIGEARPAQLNFVVRTLDDASVVAQEISRMCPRPERAALGLVELLVNAIEHGNLGLTGTEKRELREAGGWEREIERRLSLSRNAGKLVRVRFERHSGENHVWIADEGPGFDWHAYLHPNQFATTEPRCGRGIPLAQVVSFDWLEYVGTGNEVHAVIRDSEPLSRRPSFGVAV